MTLNYAPRLLKACGQRRLPNLLQEAAGLAETAMRKLGEDQQDEMRRVLESWADLDPYLNNSIIATLARHTQLEVGVTPQSTLAEISKLLSKRRSRRSNEEAAKIYTLQFDDIFQDAYLIAVRGLNLKDSLEFYTRAALGLELGSFYRDNVLMRLLDSKSAKAVPAFLKCIEPPERATFINDFGADFLIAHLGLAMHKVPLPAGKTEVLGVKEAWSAWGVVIYWTNRIDLERDQRKERCFKLWEALNGDLFPAAVGPWFHLTSCARSIFGESPDRSGYVPIDNLFPGELRDLLETGLSRLPELTNISQPFIDSEEMIKMIISYLGRLGDQSTLATLEQWADSNTLGTDVIKAIRAIRDRSSA